MEIKQFSGKVYGGMGATACHSMRHLEDVVNSYLSNHPVNEVYFDAVLNEKNNGYLLTLVSREDGHKGLKCKIFSEGLTPVPGTIDLGGLKPLDEEVNEFIKPIKDVPFIRPCFSLKSDAYAALGIVLIFYRE